jgi:hypothetical protein
VNKKSLILLTVLILSQNSFSKENEPFFKRTQYSNQALLKGINYNKWLYRISSLGTSWNGPESALQKIRERAASNQTEARDLLLQLSKVLESKKPAGVYVTFLYSDLLELAQKESPYTIDFVMKLFNLNKYTQEEKNDVHKAFENFITLNLNAPKVDQNTNLSDLDTLVSFYLTRENYDSKTLSNLIDHIADTNLNEYKISLAKKVFEMPLNRLTFSNKELTYHSKYFLTQREKLLNSLSKEDRYQIALDNMNKFELPKNNSQAYFEIKKLEYDMQVIQNIGGIEAIKQFSNIIQQMAALLNKIDKDISSSLVNTFTSYGFKPSSFRSGGGSSTYKSSGYSSNTVIGYLSNIELYKNSESEFRNTLITSANICYDALIENDENVINFCAKEYLIRLASLEVPNRSKVLVTNSFLGLLSKYQRYTDVENFETNCAEYYPEESLSNLQNDLDKMGEINFTVPTKTNEGYEGHETSYQERNSLFDRFEVESLSIRTCGNVRGSHLQRIYDEFIYLEQEKKLVFCKDKTKHKFFGISDSSREHLDTDQIRYLLEILKENTSEDSNSNITSIDEITNILNRYENELPYSYTHKYELRQRSSFLSGKRLNTISIKACIKEPSVKNCHTLDDNEISCDEKGMYKSTLNTKSGVIDLNSL